MNRYINEDALLKAVEGYTDMTRADLLDILEDIPTADVEEIRHGEWVSLIVGEAGSFDIYAHYCNECDFVYESGSEYGYKYCPNCGAKMDGKGENNER